MPHPTSSVMHKERNKMTLICSPNDLIPTTVHSYPHVSLPWRIKHTRLTVRLMLNHTATHVCVSAQHDTPALHSTIQQCSHALAVFRTTATPQHTGTDLLATSADPTTLLRPELLGTNNIRPNNKQAAPPRR
jgi:hypothetical protein